ncbi:site-specific integrase [Gaoshiqia sediminis]|uniref:Site-specific integrase n=1 Tax=Gaoshiqia sediminis TaxID=2986998 RepID=A0AA41Y911_9BACT|nr:site-specific integrase [Gaoshiqia sediminis]MCW0481435.1 site-specific integrase [Gaoshiqia sediminis]
MESMQSFGIQFVARASGGAENLVVYARITVNGSRSEVSLKQRVEPADWNPVAEKVSGRKKENKELNQFLEKVRSRLSNIYRELLVEGELPTASMVKNYFLGIDEAGNTIQDAFDYHRKIVENDISKNTLHHYKTTEKYVMEFLLACYKTENILLRKINYKFITDFEYFLRTRKPVDHQKPMQNNGVMKHIERFRVVVRLALKLDWIKTDPFRSYQIKFKKVERGFLEADELLKIEETEFKLPRLALARDLFVFSCYTGLSYIDTVQLKPEEIHLGTDGNYWIISSRQKTGVSMRIPILPKAWELIQKYTDNPRSKFNGTIFPVISNQKLNSYLKEVADLCDISKNLTYHLARHTFATTVTLSNGVPIESVSKMLGHTSIKTTQIYARIVDSKLSDDMNFLKLKLEEQKDSSLKRTV